MDRFMGLHKHLFAIAAASVLALVLVSGCSHRECPRPVTSVRVFPESTSVEISQTVAVRASVGGGECRTVRWYVNDLLGGNTTFGLITQTNPAVYTAPDSVPMPQIVLIKAASTEDPSRADTCMVTVEFTTVHVSVLAGDDEKGTGGITKPFATIRWALSVAESAMMVVAALGTYHEHSINMKSGVNLRSETGTPDCVTIDAQQLGRVFHCKSIDSTTSIEGFTITGGFAAGTVDRVGGGMLCERASPRIKDCVFSGNAAEIGGGVFCDKGSSPRFNDCIFSGNWAYTYGGAIFCDSRYEPALVRCAFLLNCADAQGGAVCTGWSSRIAVSNCTFYANAAQHGGAIHQGEEASVSMENTIIAFGNRGGAWSCHSSSSDIIIRCSDIYENAGGDWVWWIADMDTVYGNLCEDPLFCDPENGDFRLQTCSPCVPGHHPRGHDCGGLIGARGVGCDCRNPDAPRTEMGVLGFSD